MNKASKHPQTLQDYVNGILNGDRILLSRAITLVESQLENDQLMAEQLINKILPETGKSMRVGITGVPGVGKSTFIETFGLMLAESGKKVAVLTIDPTSQITKGSILGDKTRMEKLSSHANAYIRPSASGTALGGVASRTREAMLLCEAAGFDVIIIETVGVGQSETSVFKIVDFFLLLMLAGAGDELQGMKRGIMEMADLIAITKADGNNLEKSNIARAEYQSALHLMPPKSSQWNPKAVTCSALDNSGIEEIWNMILEHHHVLEQNGNLEIKRTSQNVEWLEESIQSLLQLQFRQHPEVLQSFKEIEEQVRSGKLAGNAAARMLIGKIN